MINHVRTLLLNRGREGHPLTEYGEEYVSPSFIPRVLNRPMQTVRTMLFGSKPDRLFLNYRMRQIMELMHATPLAEDILADDSRITYLPFKDDLFDQAFQPQITHIAGPDVRVHVTGSHVVNMSSGLSRQLWDIKVTATGEATIQKRYGHRESLVASFAGDIGIVLPGSQIRVFLHNAPVGYFMQVAAAARPEQDISQVLTSIVGSLGDGGLSDIFPMNAPDPVATWHRIWLNHNMAAMRYTALLLSVAYRTAQLPQETPRV